MTISANKRNDGTTNNDNNRRKKKNNVKKQWQLFSFTSIAKYVRIEYLKLSFMSNFKFSAEEDFSKFLSN